MSIILPVRDEEEMIGGCLEAIAAQDYPNIVEVVVADGGSSDRTAELAASFAKVVVVDNPKRSRPAGLNVAIARASGEILVRVDARTRIAPDYVSACVDALERTGAAIVGGPMAYEATTPAQRGVAAAMSSRLGAGPAEFRRLGGEPRYVDTVYLGAFRKEVVENLGGYDEWSGGNEDAELAFRAQQRGGVYLDPAIRSRYVVREGLGPLARQFYRYGRNRGRTMQKHPQSISPRQLAVPLLLAGLLTPWRRVIGVTYLSLVAADALRNDQRSQTSVVRVLVAVPVMHAAWGAGLLRAMTGTLVRGRDSTKEPQETSPSSASLPLKSL